MQITHMRRLQYHQFVSLQTYLYRFLTIIHNTRKQQMQLSTTKQRTRSQPNVV